MTQLYEKRGRRYVAVPAVRLDLDGDILFMCGMRYALGSGTYVPGAAMAWAEKHWSMLPENSQHVALRDVIAWLADRRLFDDPDRNNLMDYRHEWSAWALRLLALKSGAWCTSVVAAALYSPGRRDAPEVRPFLKFIQGATA